ncbi:MAG TPA: hypothetical protein VF787_27270 [Thermoanaerobaculia bacterium]
MTKERVRNWLERRFFLRIHMSLILGGTFFAGLAATNALLFAGLTNQLALRYGLAVVAAYGVFLLLIRLWLMYVRLGGISFDGSGVDAMLDFGGSSSSDVDLPIGGGGKFGGGGASDSWATPQPVVKASSGGGKSWFSFDFGDADGLLVVILFIALVIALLFAGIYIIYTAPAIFTEALFEVALAGALVKRAQKVDRPGWAGAVWRATVWPFLGILALAVVLGWAAHRACPSATRLSAALSCAATAPSAQR